MLFIRPPYRPRSSTLVFQLRMRPCSRTTGGWPTVDVQIAGPLANHGLQQLVDENRTHEVPPTRLACGKPRRSGHPCLAPTPPVPATTEPASRPPLDDVPRIGSAHQCGATVLPGTAIIRRRSPRLNLFHHDRDASLSQLVPMTIQLSMFNPLAERPQHRVAPASSRCASSPAGRSSRALPATAGRQPRLATAGEQGRYSCPVRLATRNTSSIDVIPFMALIMPSW